MCASPLEFFRSGPPPPKVTLLSDSLFFTRAVPVAAEGPEGGAAGAAGQAELALEALAPFPLAQLYHGHYWSPGSGRAFVFAAYRRRFTSDQTESWPAADLVIPAFATLFGAELEPATSVVLHAPEGLTLVHWDAGKVPSGVWFQALPPDAPQEEIDRARQGLLRRVESKQVFDLAEPPQAQPSRSDREFIFRSGELTFRLPAEVVATMDVRDREELARRRRGQKRDIVLWRIAVGSIAAMGVLVAAEIALFAGGMWQNSRHMLLKAQEDRVTQIMTAQELADRINELSSRRLMPIEMIRLTASKKPPATQFLRASTTGLYTLTVEARTTNAAEIGVFKNDLGALPSCASVEVKNPQTRNKESTFTVVVTFKPGAMKSS